MKHTTVVKSKKQTDINRFEIVIECCGEHLHPHLVSSEVINDPEKLKATLEGAHKEAAKNHHAKLVFAGFSEREEGRMEHEL